MGTLQIVRKPGIVLYKDLKRGDFFMILEDFEKKSAENADSIIFVKTDNGVIKSAFAMNPVTLDFYSVWIPPTTEVVKVKITRIDMVVQQV